MGTLLALADGLLSGCVPCTACHYCVSHSGVSKGGRWGFKNIPRIGMKEIASGAEVLEISRF